jgi:ribonuclease J
MNFKIHRGTQEIGGSCVEVWTENTRILIDFGMPLVEKDGKEFNFSKYEKLSEKELIEQGILPDIKGIYKNSNDMIDGVLISHAHQDHYGLCRFLNPRIKYYLGEATHKILDINKLFTNQEINIENYFYFEKGKTFQIGDFSITPYWADHSAFDSYSFLVEANGKSLFYSGDFRGHGRNAKVFKRFTHNAPQNVDYLLLEGTAIGRRNKPFKTEITIENELVKVFRETKKINLIYTSGQNIDRIVSVFEACKKTNKILVVDVYVAKVLKELSKFAGIPYPSKKLSNLKVMYPFYTSKKLNNEGNEKILYQFKKYKITKEEISKQSDKIVMIVRNSMQKDFEHITNIDGGNLIYSMWEGYLLKSKTKQFINYFKSRNFTIHNIHTSGHADIKTLKEMVKAIKPKNIVPIHTFKKEEYQKIFSVPVLDIQDKQVVNL